MKFSEALNWSTIYRLAREGALPITEHTVKKIRAGRQRFTDETCVVLHRITDGAVPCWLTGPDRWQPGQVPPALVDFVPGDFEDHHDSFEISA